VCAFQENTDNDAAWAMRVYEEEVGSLFYELIFSNNFFLKKQNLNSQILVRSSRLWRTGTQPVLSTLTSIDLLSQVFLSLLHLFEPFCPDFFFFFFSFLLFLLFL